MTVLIYETMTGNNVDVQDAYYMREALKLYDWNEAIRKGCNLLGISRYRYAHEVVAKWYQGESVGIVTTGRTDSVPWIPGLSSSAQPAS